MGGLRFYWLYCKDQRHNNWILKYEDASAAIIWRDRYVHMRCGTCGKVDEYAAVRSGIDDDVTIRVRKGTDFFRSSDGLICLSRKAHDVIQDNHIRGFEFVALPDPDYFVVLPTSWIEIEIERCEELTRMGECPDCGRYCETVGCVWFQPSQLPDDPLQVVAPDVPSERVPSRSAQFVISKTVIQIFKEAKLRGTYFREVGHILDE